MSASGAPVGTLPVVLDVEVGHVGEYVAVQVDRQGLVGMDEEGRGIPAFTGPFFPGLIADRLRPVTKADRNPLGLADLITANQEVEVVHRPQAHVRVDGLDKGGSLQRNEGNAPATQGLSNLLELAEKEEIARRGQASPPS